MEGGIAVVIAEIEAGHDEGEAAASVAFLGSLPEMRTVGGVTPLKVYRESWGLRREG